MAQWLWETAHVQEVVNLNPGTSYNGWTFFHNNLEGWVLFV